MDEVSSEMGVITNTLYVWAKKHPEFKEAINTSRDRIDMDVEQSLYHRAMGYTAEETRITTTTDARGGVSVKEDHYTKEYPPDPTAMIFWLKNRNPLSWRDKQDVNVTNQDDKAIKSWIAKLGL